MAVTTQTWLDAQYSVLGSILIEPELVPKVLHETSEQDFLGTCKTVYKAVSKIFSSGSPVDPVSVSASLGKQYQGFLVRLMDTTPTASNLDNYIALCKEQARTVRLQEIAKSMAEEADGEKLRALLADANAVLAERSGAKTVTMADALKSFMDRHTGSPNYLRWPIQALNEEIYASPGSFIVFGGLPSAGKTAWALQCAWFWAQTEKVGFFSLETDPNTIFDRLASSVTGISKDDIKRNRISQKGWDKICGMTKEFTARNLDIIPASGYSPEDVRAVTMMKGYDIIFVDYLQLLQSPGENRTSQVTSISIALHTLAQSLGVTVVALSQMNREAQQGNRPEMSRLRESGQIEQDADIVMILSLEKEQQPGGNRILSIAKNKEGTRPKVLLAFDGQHQIFSKALQTSAVAGKLASDGRKARRANKTPESAYYGQQMELLPDDTPVPFQEQKEGNEYGNPNNSYPQPQGWGS